MKKIRNLAQSEGLKQSALVMGGNVVAQGMSALALILISRRLGPQAFGDFVVGFALVLMLSKINDLGLTYAQQKFVPLRKKYNDKNELLSLSVQLKLIVAGIIFVSGLILVPLLSSWLNFENTTILYLAFGLSVATVAFEQLMAMLQSLFKFPHLVVSNMMQAGGKLLGAVVLWGAGVATAGIFFFAYMLAPIIPAIFSKKLLPNEVSIVISKNYLPETKKIATMAKHSAVAFVAAGIIENIDILMVQGYLQEYEAGLYGGATRIAMLFTMFAFSLATVLNPRVARYAQKINMDKYLKKVGMLLGACTLGLLIILPFSGLMIWATVGNSYSAAMPALNVLLASSFVLIGTVAMMATFFAFPKSEWYFSVAGVLQLTALVIFNLWLIPDYGLMGAAWARFWSRMVLFGFTAMMLGYFYQKTYRNKSVSEVNV